MNRTTTRQIHTSSGASTFLRLSLLLGLWLGTAIPAFSQTNISIDNSLSSARVIPDGGFGSFLIETSDGTGMGDNLFFSFSNFDLLDNDTATFEGAAYTNILARVTGGNGSTIDGKIVAPANLFFMDPKGIIFQDGADFEINGTLTFTTANQINFGDGDFQAKTADVTLSSSSVESFGFTAASPQGITFEEGAKIRLGSSAVPTTINSINFVAGDISFEKGSGLEFDPTGSIRLVSVGSAGTAQVNVSDASKSSTLDFTSLGDITMFEAEFSSRAYGKRSGDITLEADSIHLIGSDLYADSWSGDGGGILLIAEHVRLEQSPNALAVSGFPGSGSQLITTNKADASGSKGGDIRIEAALVEFLHDTMVDSSTDGAGRGGQVIINNLGGSLYLFGDSNIQTGSGGPVDSIAGKVDIDVKSVFIGSDSRITSFGGNTSGDFGVGGAVEIDAENVELLGRILVENENGAGGEVVINASESFILYNGVLPDEDLFVASGVSLKGHSLVNGDIVTVVSDGELPQPLSLSEHYLVQSVTETSFQLADMNGNVVNLTTAGDQALVVRKAALSVSALSAATDIFTLAGHTFKNGDLVTIEGQAGGVLPTVDFQSNTSDGVPIGPISISQTERYEVREVSGDSFRLAETFNNDVLDVVTAGSGGLLIREVAEVGDELFPSIFADSGGDGKAGNIQINVPGERARFYGGQVSSNSLPEDPGETGIGGAGSIGVSAGSIYSESSRFLSSALLGEGPSGSVELIGTESIELVGTTVVGAQAGGTGAAGDVIVQTPDLITYKESVIASDNFVNLTVNGQLLQFPGAGDGGTVTISAEKALIGGLVSARTVGPGNAGDVNINVDELYVSGTISSVADSTVDDNLEGVAEELFEVNTYGPEDIGAAGQVRIARVLPDPNIDPSAFAVFDATPASKVVVEAEGSILASTDSTNAIDGAIVIRATELDVFGSINSRTTGEARGADIYLPVEDIHIEGFVTGGTTGSGDSADVTIFAERLSMEGGSLSVSTGQQNGLGGGGEAGDITIQATESVILDGKLFFTNPTTGEDFFIPSSISLTSAYAGDGLPGEFANAGNIDISTPLLELRKGSSLEVTSGFGANEQFSSGSLGNAGKISIDGDTVVMSEGSFIDSSAFGVVLPVQPGDLGDPANLIAYDAAVRDYFEVGNLRQGGEAGLITLSLTDSLFMSGTSRIQSASSGSADSGSITIVAGNEVSLKGAASISTEIGAYELTLTDLPPHVTPEVEPEVTYVVPGEGNAGEIYIATSALKAGPNTQIVSDTEINGNSGIGSAGSIFVESEEAYLAGIVSTTTTTDNPAGQVDLQVNRLAVTGTVSSETTGGSGPAGNVAVYSGFGVDGGLLPSERVNIKKGGSITTKTTTAGDGGTIQIDTLKLKVLDGGTIEASTEAQIGGKGGSVTLNVLDDFVVDGGGIAETGVIASTEGGGNAGSISVSVVDRMELLNGGVILGSTSGSGNGGNINVSTDDLTIDGGTSGLPTGISAASSGSGLAGTVTIDVLAEDTLYLLNGGFITSESTGTGGAGSIFIDSAGLVQLDSNSLISVLAEGQNADAGDIIIVSGSNVILNGGSAITAASNRDAGNIEITAQDFIWLTDSSIIAEAQRNGGNVILRDATFGLLNRSLISANAVNGNGGFIQIGTDVLLTNSSIISASSDFGVDGEVRVDGISDLSGTQAGLDAGLLDASNQLQDRCTVRVPGERGSFVLVGRGGLPVMPGRFLPAQQLLKLDE